MRAWRLALFGLAVVAAAPASAESRTDAKGSRAVASTTRAAAQPRTTVRVLPSLVGTAAAATTGAATAPMPAARGHARHAALAAEAAPLRGRLTGTSTRHAALSSDATCARGRTACRAPKMSWTRGLPPAAGVQAQECPDGTMATPARGHENIIRCMPL